MIDISGLDKSEVLAALYNRTHVQGLGVLHYDSKDMTKEEAQELLNSGCTYFDYLKGRVMKVDLSKNEFDPYRYDRNNYQGAAQDAVNMLRK
jgi:hypothetical protein